RGQAHGTGRTIGPKKLVARAANIAALAVSGWVPSEDNLQGPHHCFSPRSALSRQSSASRQRFLAELPLDVASDQLDGERVGNVAHGAVLLEVVQVGERHALTQLQKALVRYGAVAHELRVPLEDSRGEQLVARNLDGELALQSEDDVQKVNRLRTQVALQSRL